MFSFQNIERMEKDKDTEKASVNIDLLPTELLCYILSKADGRSLACAARVCERWHVAVTILEKGFNIWYRFVNNI